MRLDDAICVAAHAHQGQTDKGGAPYILHPLRLMLQMPDDDHRIVAVLHDVIEDSAVTAPSLRARGLSEPLLDALDCLTRRKGETYSAFILRCGSNPIARSVKMADLADNMDLSRLRRDVTDADFARNEKYYRAYRTLSDGRPPIPTPTQAGEDGSA